MRSETFTCTNTFEHTTARQLTTAYTRHRLKYHRALSKKMTDESVTEGVRGGKF